MDEEVATAPATEAGSIRKHHRRNAVQDLLLPLAAILAVVSAIVAIELYRDRAATAPAPGAFSPIDIGLRGGGSPKIGSPAPAFRLVDAAGQVVGLDDFRGRPVVLNFWATWCIPCQREAPDFVDAQTRWSVTAQIVGVDYSESAAAVREFAATFEINYPLPLDSDGSVTGAYKLTGLPETFFLDRDGVIRDHRIGQVSPRVLDCIVTNLLKGAHQPEECR